jgi:hypothetical protein
MLSGLKENWYLYKGYPRKTKSGSSHSAATPQLKYARKFKNAAAAAAVIKNFTPSIFDGKEKIMEITN